MSEEKNKAIVRRFLQESINLGNLEVIDELLTADYIAHDPNAPGGKLDREAEKQSTAMFRNGIANLQETIEDIIAEGDRVMVRVTVHGKHQGELWGLPPTGKEIFGEGIALYRVVDGSIRESWVYRDALGLFQQLGAPPLLTSD